jgi:hypothetical protein
LGIDRERIFQEPSWLEEDEPLRQAVKACVDATQAAGADALASRFRRHPDALSQVSEDALARILARGDTVSDVRTNTDLSNCLVFHTNHLPGTVMDDCVVRLRRDVDELVKQRAFALFGGNVADVEISGHFWYPRGGYMGWHTNLRKPGWRLYLQYAEEPGKSFFRYRDPGSGEIVTRVDAAWNLSLFEIRPDAPLWHCVYSETNRHSFGYRISAR